METLRVPYQAGPLTTLLLSKTCLGLHTNFLLSPAYLVTWPGNTPGWKRGSHVASNPELEGTLFFAGCPVVAICCSGGQRSWQGCSSWWVELPGSGYKQESSSVLDLGPLQAQDQMGCQHGADSCLLTDPVAAPSGVSGLSQAVPVRKSRVPQNCLLWEFFPLFSVLRPHPDCCSGVTLSSAYKNYS